MKKVIFLSTLAMVACLGLILFGPSKVLANKLNTNKSYKGIVKIYTYYEDGNNGFIAGKTSSGVIVNDNGLVLASQEAVILKDANGLEIPTVFNICLTKDNPYQPPICSYSADLAAQNDSLDLALLQINNFTNIFSDYGSIALAGHKPALNYKVYAYGYTAFGGDTTFGLTGEVNDITERNGRTWVKSDVLSSFNPGAALMDISGDLIGIVTSLSDNNQEVMLIDASDIFINQPLAQSSQVLALRAKFASYLKNLILLRTNHKYINAKPSIELNNWTGWKIIIQDANGFSLYIPQSTPNEPDTYNLELPLPWKAEQVKPFHHSVLVNQVNDFVGTLWGFLQTLELLDDPINLKEPAVAARDFNETELKEAVSESLEKNTFNPISWDTYIRSEEVDIVSPIHDESGFINLSWKSAKSLVTEEVLDDLKHKIIQEMSCVDLGKTKISNREENVIRCPMSEDEVQVILFGIDNYLTLAVYGYGKNKNNVTQAPIDYLIRSITVSEHPEEFNEQPAYTDIEQTESEQTEDVSIPSVDIPEVSNNENLSNSNQIQDAGNQAQNVEVKTKDILNIGKKLMGRIVLQVENRGQAWYLSPKTNQAHYLENGAAAYQLMREQGLGIADADLSKISVGLNSGFEDTDTDQDGLSDDLEKSLKTDPEKADSDNDGYPDGTEVANDYSPLGVGRLAYDNSLVNKLKGRILLQVESRGQAWYVNPDDGKRYFLGQANDAYQIMNYLGLGISDEDFNRL